MTPAAHISLRDAELLANYLRQELGNLVNLTDGMVRTRAMGWLSRIAVTHEDIEFSIIEIRENERRA